MSRTGSISRNFKLGHCEIQNRPPRVKTGQYPPPVLAPLPCPGPKGATGGFERDHPAKQATSKSPAFRPGWIASIDTVSNVEGIADRSEPVCGLVDTSPIYWLHRSHIQNRPLTKNPAHAASGLWHVAITPGDDRVHLRLGQAARDHAQDQTSRHRSRRRQLPAQSDRL